MTPLSNDIQLQFPLSDDIQIRQLRAGDTVSISGYIYTARDAAHKLLTEQLRAGETPPFDFNGAAVFYAGPCPAPPGMPIGSIGPTTSSRMDSFAPFLISRGLKFMIGKGQRSLDVKNAIAAHNGLYLAAIGGAAALMAKSVLSADIVAYPQLGTEAIRRLLVRNLPLVIAIDTLGNSIYP